MRTLATAEGDVADIRTRAALRVQAEQLRQQQAIEEITVRALPHLTEKPDPAKVDDDWLIQFFGIAREVTNDDMRSLWARILAGEFNSPGAFSRRTLHVVGNLDQRDAEMFAVLRRFAVSDETHRPVPVVLNVRDEIYENAGLSFAALADLDSIGLLRFDHITGFNVGVGSTTLALAYCDQRFTLELPPSSLNELRIGTVMLTKAGIELAHSGGALPVPGFLEYLRVGWGRWSVGMTIDAPGATGGGS
jgi:hypothetical protein